MTVVTVVEPGPLATVQDLGRPGYAHLGVPGSGAADRGALMLANRLVGNRESAAGIESTLGGLRLSVDRDILVAVTGAHAVVRVDGRPVGGHAATLVPAGGELFVEPPAWGARCYVAVRGGIDVPPVLGSRSTDTLSGLGPRLLMAGTLLQVGSETGDWPPVSAAPVSTDYPRVTELFVGDGPRRDHVARPQDLFAGVWEVSPDSNRVGVRLDRAAESSDPLVVHGPDGGELASEGIAHGSVQVPPSGRPVIFLADHPVTGGYPVIAVLTAGSLGAAAQLVAGSTVRFRSL